MDPSAGGKTFWLSYYVLIILIIYTMPVHRHSLLNSSTGRGKGHEIVLVAVHMLWWAVFERQGDSSGHIED